MLCQRQATARRHENNQQGFTLLEIMIVTVIIGIAAGLSAPTFNMMFARADLYQSTVTLYNRLVLARSAAISRNVMLVASPPVTISGLTQIPFTAPLPSETLPGNVTVLAFPVQPIGFTPRGLSTTPLATQTIQLQSIRDPSLIYSISLAPSGKVTWCRRAINPCVINETS